MSMTPLEDTPENAKLPDGRVLGCQGQPRGWRRGRAEHLGEKKWLLHLAVTGLPAGPRRWALTEDVSGKEPGRHDEAAMLEAPVTAHL